MDLPPEAPAPGLALVEELDKRLLVQMRDGRKFVGILRSFDQFANLVMEDAVERIIVGTQYAEVPLGLYILRGDNVILLGEIDPSRDPPEALSRVSKDVISRAVKAEKEQDKLKAGMASRFDFLED